MRPRIRILHLIETLGRGGAEGLLYTNLSRLDRDKFDGVVCHLYDQELHWRQPIKDLGYPVFSLGMASLQDAPRGFFRLCKLLQREHIDLIHSHLYRANLFGRLVGPWRGVPFINSLHSVDYEPSLSHANPAVSQTKLKILRFLDRLSCRFGDPEFLAVSHYVKESVVSHLKISPARIRVIYNSINSDVFEPTGKGNTQLRTDLGIDSHVPVVLCVGRFHPEKGLKYLIEAIPILVRRFPDIFVIFVGGGAADASRIYSELAERLGIASRVHFPGIQSDVRPYLQLCDVFVLPSLAEGLGVAILEAMAMERACVSTRVAAIPEVIADGRSGILVKPGDPPALAEAITRLLTNPALRAQMGKEGRQIVLERFNIARNILDLEMFYQHVLKERSDRR